MRTKPETGTAGAKKGILKEAKTVLYLSVLTILVIIAYFVYTTISASQGSDTKKKDSTAVTQEEQNIEKGGDRLLKITKATLQVESVDNIDRIRVVVDNDRLDKGNSSYKYEWFRNSISVGDNGDSFTGFTKGDKIDVRITPFYGKEPGRPVFLTMTIAHVPPKVVENRTVDFAENRLSHQVKAVDPDGGTLFYSLVDAPKGMAIDSKTGVINWDVDKSEHGKHDVNVIIKSSSGAQALYPISIDLGKTN